MAKSWVVEQYKGMLYMYVELYMAAIIRAVVSFKDC